MEKPSSNHPSGRFSSSHARISPRNCSASGGYVRSIPPRYVPVVTDVDDVLAITALVHRYAELIDSGDLDGVAALFERGTWRAGTRDFTVQGTEAVRRMYDGVIL